MNLSSRICRLHSSFLSLFASSCSFSVSLSFPFSSIFLNSTLTYLTHPQKKLLLSQVSQGLHTGRSMVLRCAPINLNNIIILSCKVLREISITLHSWMQSLDQFAFFNIMFIFSSSFLICIVGVNETKTLRSIITRSMTQKKIKYFFYIRRRSCNVRPRCPCPGRPQGCVSHPRWKLALDHGSFAGPPGFKIWVQSQERLFKSGWLLLANFWYCQYFILPQKSPLFWPFFAVGNGFSSFYLGSASQPGWPACWRGDREGGAYVLHQASLIAKKL